MKLCKQRVLLKLAFVWMFACTCLPTFALANDDSLSAADILLPKPEEFIPALIAFIVIWAVLAHFIWPSVVKTLDDRQKAIQDNLDAAEQSKLDAAEALKTAKGEITKAQNRADDIVAEAKRTADAKRAAILEEANANAKRIVDKTRENIEIEKQNAVTELTNQAANLAVELAEKIIDKELDKKTQHALIAQALKEAEKQEA